MIDHTAIHVPAAVHKACVAWYTQALAPLNYAKLLAFGPNEEAVGFGDRTMAHHQMHTDWWILAASGDNKPATSHHAFRCKDHEAVDAFYEAAIKAGGKDNGKPGLRTHYHAKYYGAFVLDPAGNNIEAVCHD